jgi:hypothetical protein
VSWIGNSTPPNPSHYFADESNTAINYDWNHPKSILASPGPGGLCASSFQAFAASAVCPGADQYVQSYNFGTKEVTCKSIPTCGATQSLEFSGSDFYCSNDRYTNIVNFFGGYIYNISIPPTYSTINYYRDSANSYMDYVYNRFGQLGSRANGSTTSIGASNDSGCAQLSRGSCPNGYLMYGYEARQQGSGSCHASCVKIAPP